MSRFQGGGNRSFNNRRGNQRSRGGSGGFGNRNSGPRGNIGNAPPERVVEIGTYVHSAEGDLVVKNTLNKIPYNNSFVYLENMAQIGKVEEIFGRLDDHLSTGFIVSSFEMNQKLYADPSKILPIERFFPQNGIQKKHGNMQSAKNSSYNNAGKQTNQKFTNSRGGNQQGGHFRHSGGNFNNRGGRGSFRGNKQNFTSRSSTGSNSKFGSANRFTN